MDKAKIESDMRAFCTAAGVNKANWSQKAAIAMLMAITRKRLRAAGIAMPDDVREELMQIWELHGLACNASQLRQFLFVPKEGAKATDTNPYAVDLPDINARFHHESNHREHPITELWKWFSSSGDRKKSKPPSYQVSPR
jgi:hypothetical protein